MVSICQELHALPSEGGLLDQDYLNVIYIQMVLEQQGIKREKDAKEAERKRKQQTRRR